MNRPKKVMVKLIVYPSEVNVFFIKTTDSIEDNLITIRNNLIQFYENNQIEMDLTTKEK